METNRRALLKQMALGITGIGLTNSKALAFNGLSSVSADNQIIYLRSNENPYGPSPLAIKAFSNNVSLNNRYNWAIASQLMNALAFKNKVKEENILLGAGSTEMLDLVSRLVSLKLGNYVIADPTYDYWTATLDGFGMQKIKVALLPNKKMDLTGMLNAINNDTRLVYICNPNNPSGTICERNALVDFIHKIPKETYVLIDEAYLDYTNQESIVKLIETHSNVIIVKTFSKIYGLAGARIGYAIADSSLINKLIDLQSNTNNSVSVLSKLAAIASLKDLNFVDKCLILNEKARKYTQDELEKLGMECISSNTNFIYFSLANYKNDYFKKLEDHHIEGTRLYEEAGKWTRITVGTMDEMKKFINALK